MCDYILYFLKSNAHKCTPSIWHGELSDQPLAIYTTKIYCIGAICDWACKITTYLHIKICPIFELQFAESFEAILVTTFLNHLIFNEENTVYTTWISYREQEIYQFLNTCNLCKYMASVCRPSLI